MRSASSERMREMSSARSESSLRRTSADEERSGAVDAAIARAQEFFFARQDPSGYWQAPLEANVTMGSEYVFFNRFLGLEKPEQEQRILAYVRLLQREDGSWPLFVDGPGHLSATVEAYAALKMAGAKEDDPTLVRARGFIRANGGLECAGVFTKIFLAYFGEVPWSAVPTLPVELMLVPPWTGVSIYEMSSWARGTVVPLLVLMAVKPEIRIPGFTVQELYVDPSKAGELYVPREVTPFSLDAFFLALDKVFKAWARVPQPLRSLSIRRACQWVLDHQDWNGGWGGIQPPMVYGPMALRAAGYAMDHPAVAKGIQALDDFLIELPEGHLILQPCVSPVWDTALACKALLDSGVAEDHPALVQAAGWLMDQQVRKPGDWSIKNPKLPPGGWVFEFANDWYPDVDDSAVILMVLRRIRHPDQRRMDEVIRRGLGWTLGMQSKNGGYAAFDTDNTLELLNKIPFADMEAMIDPPTADITGRILELMGDYHFDASDPRAARALDFVRRTQERDGSWWGRWGVNFVYGTWSVLAGLRAIGEDPASARVRSAVRWLESVQKPDGSFGEDCRSYANAKTAGQGATTASQTAWGLLGLLAGETGVTPAIDKAVDHLLETQNPAGVWDDRLWTGTGFPKHFYLKYWWYAAYFPLMALGQYAGRAHEEGTTRG